LVAETRIAFWPTTGLVIVLEVRERFPRSRERRDPARRPGGRREAGWARLRPL